MSHCKNRRQATCVCTRPQRFNPEPAAPRRPHRRCPIPSVQNGWVGVRRWPASLSAYKRTQKRLVAWQFPRKRVVHRGGAEHRRQLGKECPSGKAKDCRHAAGRGRSALPLNQQHLDARTADASSRLYKKEGQVGVRQSPASLVKLGQRSRDPASQPVGVSL